MIAAVVMLWLAMVVAGGLLGNARDRKPVAGVVVTILLGPLGLLLAANFPKTNTVSAGSAARGDSGPSASGTVRRP